MIDVPTLRRLALVLPEARDRSSERGLAFSVGGKEFAWTWQERVEPRRPRRPRLDVLAVRCRLETKEMLLDAAPDRFFDENHYLGYPAVLVRLDVIDAGELASLLGEAWRLAAPKRLVARLGAAPPEG